MTETEQAAAATQAANGRAPVPGPVPEPDTGEKWLGVIVIAAACFLLFVGLDRVTGGALSRPFSGAGGDDAGG